MDEPSPTTSQSHPVKEPANEPLKREKPEGKVRDNWDKADIIFRSVGAFATAAVVAGVGIFGSNFLARRQEKETNLRLYTELMSRREEAETSLRKEMFAPLFAGFLNPTADEPSEKIILNLELLSYNFHESVDLGPLFKTVYRKLEERQQENQPYIERLVRVAQDVRETQLAKLAEPGGKRDGLIDFRSLEHQPGGITVMDVSFQVGSGDPAQPATQKKVRIEVLSADSERQEFKVRLMVRGPADNDEADAVFTVSQFDFPMVRNLRLAGGYRCAIVINAFDPEFADFTFVYFPGARGSYKETEILRDLRQP